MTGGTPILGNLQITVNEASHRKHAVDETNPNAPSMVLYIYQKDPEGMFLSPSICIFLA